MVAVYGLREGEFNGKTLSMTKFSRIDAIYIGVEFGQARASEEPE